MKNKKAGILIHNAKLFLFFAFFEQVFGNINIELILFCEFYFKAGMLECEY